MINLSTFVRLFVPKTILRSSFQAIADAEERVIADGHREVLAGDVAAGILETAAAPTITSATGSVNGGLTSLTHSRRGSEGRLSSSAASSGNVPHTGSRRSSITNAQSERGTSEPSLARIWAPPCVPMR